MERNVLRTPRELYGSPSANPDIALLYLINPTLYSDIHSLWDGLYGRRPLAPRLGGAGEVAFKDPEAMSLLKAIHDRGEVTLADLSLLVQDSESVIRLARIAAAGFMGISRPVSRHGQGGAQVFVTDLGRERLLEDLIDNMPNLLKEFKNL